MGSSVFPVVTQGTEPNWKLLATSSNVTTTSITYTSLSGYNRYRIIIPHWYYASSTDTLSIQFNGDTSLIYSYAVFYEAGTTAAGNQTGFGLSVTADKIILGPSASASYVQGLLVIDISNASYSDIQKTVTAKGSFHSTDLAGVLKQVTSEVNASWPNTSSTISSIRLFSAGSSAFTIPNTTQPLQLLGAN